jgi:hypothetical protein
VPRASRLLVLAVVGAGLLGAGRWLADADPRHDPVETSRVRGWARAEGGAGVSVLPKRVPPADDGELRRLRELPGFHEFAMRCSSCHVLPDPAAYPAGRWRGKVDEMGEHIRRAGVVPPSPAELDAAIEFLDAASAALRTR